MNYRCKAFYYTQNKQEYMSLILPFHIISKISKVLVYGKDKYGYQRDLSERHYSKIKNSLLKDDIILPTSIILSVNRDDIIDSIQKQDDSIMDLSINLDHKLFRIVDGQHRLKGLEEAARTRKELEDFVLNVIVLITKENERLVEVEAFRDINSKAQKIKTDLTLLAKYNYEMLGEKEIENENEHISIKVAYYLHEKMENSVWRNSIKFDFNAFSNQGIIEVNAFMKAILPVVKTLIDKLDLSVYKDIESVDLAAEKIANIISKAWNIVEERWSTCFDEKIEKDVDDGYIKTYFNNKYYIQKTTGANALNMLLNEALQDTNTIEEGLDKFNDILKKSYIKSEDWLVGKKFSGLTSGSGFKKAKKYIMNDE